MADLNEVRLIGRLTRDPIAKVLPSGTQICEFGLATGRKWTAQDGEKKEDTLFVDVSCFGKLGEVAEKFLAKGRSVFVGGRLKFDTWEDRNSGQKRSKISVVAENIQFLERREEPNQQFGESEYGMPEACQAEPLPLPPPPAPYSPPAPYLPPAPAPAYRQPQQPYRYRQELVQPEPIPEGGAEDVPF